MIKIDFAQPSTWRGAAMIVAGAVGIWLIAPEIAAIRSATSPDQVQFAVTKSLAFGSSFSALGQIASGLIGFLFSDKPN